MPERYRRGRGSAVRKDGEALLGDAVNAGEVAAHVEVALAGRERPYAEHAGGRVHVGIPAHEHALERQHEELVPLDAPAGAVLVERLVLARRDVVAVHPEDRSPAQAGRRLDVAVSHVVPPPGPTQTVGEGGAAGPALRGVDALAAQREVEDVGAGMAGPRQEL